MYGHDKVIGECVLGFTVFVVIYYLFWIVGLPFTDEDSSLRPFFPDPIIALIVPAVILVFLLTLTGVYITVALYKDYKAKGMK